MQPSSTATIERATRSDITSIVELKLAMFSESGRAHLLPPAQRTLVRQDYESLYDSDLAAHFVIRHEGTIIACAGAFLKSDLPYRYFTPSVYGFIGDVYTVPSARGMGLARLLSSAAIAWLKSKGVQAVRLLASQAARSIYVSLGFVPTDEMVLHISHDDGRAPSAA